MLCKTEGKKLNKVLHEKIPKSKMKNNLSTKNKKIVKSVKN